MKVRPHLFTKNGKPKGNKREITVTIGLAVVLTWFRTRGSAARTFSMVFGLTSKPLYKWLKYSRKVLLYVLQNHPDAIIRPPSDEEVEAYVAATGRNYEALRTKRVWGAADGLKVKLQHSNNWAIFKACITTRGSAIHTLIASLSLLQTRAHSNDHI